jgi:IstB-like ATP binding protein
VRARDEGLSHVILDGKIVPADRCREKTLSVQGEPIDLWYSGKAHAHGGNIQAVLDRLLHHAHVVVTNGDSYRMREARAKGGTSTKKN